MKNLSPLKRNRLVISKRASMVNCKSSTPVVVIGKLSVDVGAPYEDSTLYFRLAI